MAGVQRFEDLVAWQKARALVKEVYQLCRKEIVCRDFNFCNQLTSSALSIMSNIAEGFERQSNKEFVRFLTISIASCAELRSQVYAAMDLGYASEDEFTQLQAKANEVARLTKGLRTALLRSSALNADDRALRTKN